MDSASGILVLSCLGIAQALFLCCYLFTLKKGNRKAHVFLALLILGLTLRIGKSILNEYLQLLPWQRNLGIAGILLVGPSLWFYGKLLFRQEEETPKWSYLHFIPYVLFSAFSAMIPNRFDFASLLIYYLVFGHLLFYILLSAVQCYRFRQNIRKPLFNWYRNLVIGVSIIWGFYIGNVSGVIPFYIGGAICYTFLVYLFSFLFLRKHTFSLEKYQRSSMDAHTSRQLMEATTELFSSREIYLEPQLSLQEVSTILNTSPRKLSQVVNENKGMNFSEFVNSYRIEKAKTLLTAPEHKKEKMATIAYDSGFGNVTSFNLAFKSFTNLTPSEFRKRNGK